MSTTKKTNTDSKRESEIREHISNACLIGLGSLYGLSVDVKVPLFRGSGQFLSKSNLLVYSTSYFSPEVPIDKIVDRNGKKSAIAHQFNFIFQWIKTCDPNLHFQETKARRTSKSVKLMKFSWIDPFNEMGFEVFADGVMRIVEERGRMLMGRSQIVRIPERDPVLFQLYENILMDQRYLSVEGKRYSAMIASMSGTAGQTTEENGIPSGNEQIGFDGNQDENGQINMYNGNM